MQHRQQAGAAAAVGDGAAAAVGACAAGAGASSGAIDDTGAGAGAVAEEYRVVEPGGQVALHFHPRCVCILKSYDGP